ncbi:MAG: energy-coupling factor transporter transmembrane component T family protein [Alkaliphilus sp.]
MKNFYYKQNSFLHRLNPISKMLSTIPLVLLVLFVTDPWTPIIFCLLFALVTVGLGKIPLLHYSKIMLPLVIFSLIFVITYPFLVSVERVTHTPIAFSIGAITVYWGGIVFAIVIALRMCAIIMSALLFSLTTNFSDFIGSLVQQLKVPYKIGYTSMAAFRFIPMLNFELTVIRAAHKIRGISARSGPRSKFQQMKRYTVPLLSTAIRKAERTALAMDSRAFGAFENRTYYRVLKFKSSDFIYVIAFWILGASIVVLLREFGLFGNLLVFQML